MILSQISTWSLSKLAKKIRDSYTKATFFICFQHVATHTFTSITIIYFPALIEAVMFKRLL